MNVNDIIDVRIDDSGMNGEGVARVDGKVVFVPFTLRGEKVRAVVRSVKKNYATASVIKVTEPSPHRIAPTCKHYYKCGGCDTGHIDEEYRREMLLGELKNNLKKIAGVDCSPSEFVPSRGVARNKISMPFGMSCGKVVLGMYRQGTHDVEPVDCLQSSELVREIARTVCRFADRNKLSVYNDATGRGLLRHLVVRHVGARAAAVLVINADRLPRGEDELSRELPSSCDFFVSRNVKRGNVIMGDFVRKVRGNDHLNVDVLGVKAELSPLSFFQVNDGVRDKLYTAALDCITAPTLIDLYSGIGITSNLAAKKCDKVYAVECVAQAVENADRTAELNGNSDRIENFCGNVEDVLPKLAPRIDGDVDVLVDPPRKGCGLAVMRAIAELSPRTVVYVSCNHATMCRDIQELVSDGYYLERCTVFDMFPGTHHVETLICLKRKQPK